MRRILIIEDDESILMALEDDLGLEGFEVSKAVDGAQGLSLAEENAYDLIILDIMLPKMDGLEICKRLRQQRVMTPILILTAKCLEVDKILGLELGADDYVTKPFSPRELLARVKAILRRSRQIEREQQIYEFGNVKVNFKKYEIEKAGKSIYLTALEFALLHFFIKHEDEALSRDVILNEIWGEQVYVTPRTVDTHVAHLRRKLEDDPSEPEFIVGVRGVGYKFTT